MEDESMRQLAFEFMDDEPTREMPAMTEPPAPFNPEAELAEARLQVRVLREENARLQNLLREAYEYENSHG